MDYRDSNMNPDALKEAKDHELINVLAPEDMPAIRLAEKIKAANLDLIPIRNAEHASVEWMLKQWPSLEFLRVEVAKEGYWIPTDSDVWWAACNAAYDPVCDWYDGYRQWRGTLESRA